MVGIWLGFVDPRITRWCQGDCDRSAGCGRAGTTCRRPGRNKRAGKRGRRLKCGWRCCRGKRCVRGPYRSRKLEDWSPRCRRHGCPGAGRRVRGGNRRPGSRRDGRKGAGWHPGRRVRRNRSWGVRRNGCRRIRRDRSWCIWGDWRRRIRWNGRRGVRQDFDRWRSIELGTCRSHKTEAEGAGDRHGDQANCQPNSCGGARPHTRGLRLPRPAGRVAAEMRCLPVLGKRTLKSAGQQRNCRTAHPVSDALPDHIRLQ